VVTPAQALMAIVPAETHLEIEAMISNRDIGFVEVGQHMSIKVDTFNSRAMACCPGKLVTVSHDVITRDKPQEQVIE
jgi:hemolysin D